MEYVVSIPSIESRFEYDQTVFNLGNFYITPNLFYNDWMINEHSIIGELFTSEIADYYGNVNAPESYTIASTGAFKEDNKGYSNAARDFALFFSDRHSVHTERIDNSQVKYYYTNEHVKYISYFSETVQKALQQYILEFEFDIVNTDSFIQHWSNATEVDLSQFFLIYLARF